MNKADFEALAAALRKAKPLPGPGLRDAVRGWESACNAAADACLLRYRGTYSFNRPRFLLACGLEVFDA